MRKYKRFNIKFKLLIIFIITIFMLNYFETFIRQSVKEISSSNCNIIANEIVTKQVDKILKDKGINYDEFVTIKHKENGDISSLSVNNLYVNKFQNEINQNIVKSLKELETQDIKVSMGSLTGSKWLYGRGFKLSMKTVPIGKLKTKIKSQFEENGINQTIHRLYLDVNLNMKALLGFYSVSENIDISIMICETVIVGNVPQYYTNVEGESKEAISNINDYAPSGLIDIE